MEEILSLLRPQRNSRVPTQPDYTEMRVRFLKLVGRVLHKDRTTKEMPLNRLIEDLGVLTSSCTVATFNWDCLFEESYRWKHGSYWPKLVIKVSGWPRLKKTNAFTLLKLHGSISWWIDQNSKEISYAAPNAKTGTLESKWFSYQRSSSEHPLMLEPSSKKYDDPNFELLQPQWDYFAKELARADICIIAGYSLPEGDEMARKWLLEANRLNTNLKWIVVDPSDETLRKYAKLLGESRLRPINSKIEEFDVGLAVTRV